jgi:Na+/melibiose symporter-like transporter
LNPTGSAALLAYGLLRAPLALLELPLFVLLPAYYATQLGMELALIGTVLFGARLIDALADPAIGVMIDRSERADAYRRWILGALPLLALGYLALFHPPAGMNRAAWLTVMSILTYLAYSAVSIAYQAWGARLGNTPVERVNLPLNRSSLLASGAVKS